MSELSEIAKRLNLKAETVARHVKDIVERKKISELEQIFIDKHFSHLDRLLRDYAKDKKGAASKKLN